MASIPSATSLASSGSAAHTAAPRHTIDQLALNMGFGGLRPVAPNPPSLSASSLSSSASLVNSTNPVHQPLLTTQSSQLKFEPVDSISLNTEFSNETDTDLKERVITKIDPADMTAKPATVSVPKDPVKRAAMLLAGPKFQLNSSVIPTDKLTLNNDTIYSVAVSIKIIARPVLLNIH